MKFVLILFIIVLSSCGPSKDHLEYKDSIIKGKVDSLIIRKMSDLKKHFFLVENKWFSVPAGYYTRFFKYIEKGDSLYKDRGRWDIYVYKKKKGKYIERYFEGAQDYWD